MRHTCPGNRLTSGRWEYRVYVTFVGGEGSSDPSKQSSSSKAMNPSLFSFAQSQIVAVLVATK